MATSDLLAALFEIRRILRRIESWDVPVELTGSHSQRNYIKQLAHDALYLLDGAR